MIGQLSKAKAKRVIGMDCSTHSLAFAVFEGEKPVTCGEVILKGANVYERLADARVKTQALVDAGILVGDYVAIEAAAMVNNMQVTIKLAYVYGAVMSVLMQNRLNVERVAPISWQSGIGNPNLTKAEKEQLEIDFPGKSKSWYKDEGRRIRKQRTMDIAKQYFTIPGDSDNVSDSVGIALYTTRTLTRAE